jgi:two-component system, cell cycle response regulator DivK
MPADRRLLCALMRCPLSFFEVAAMPLALLVEDNLMNRKLFRDILETQFEVLEAESAETALDLLEHHHPDLILLDIQLPGMDGLSFLRLVKKHPPWADIPVVALSAHALKEDIRQALDTGCTEYVTKPLTEDPLCFAERMARLALAAVCT